MVGVEHGDGSGGGASAPGYSEGQLIGEKYLLRRRLGEGGMASVWVAYNEALDIEVAIKFIRTELQNLGLTNRLLQEARAAARLGHPAIVRVSDFGKTPVGDPYIVMELLTGEDLGATIKRRGTMAPLRAVRTLLPIADALAAAHQKRIVHRDLKPENIFLSHTEDNRTQPKLVDFGIAKLEREDAQRITQLGATMGSPAYMSPEQARGLDVDARTDVWAFAVVLYETLTGQLPFSGPTYTALVCGILESQPRSIMECGVPEVELWNLIARGFEKDPTRRWGSMREFGAALARWAMSRGASDDITGASLHSAWVERPADSAPPTEITGATSMLPTPIENPAHRTGNPNVGTAATQLSASMAQAPMAKNRSALFIGIAAAAAVLVLGIGVAARVALNRPKPEQPAAGADANRAPSAPPSAPVVAPTPKVEPDVAEPAVSAEPSPSSTEPKHVSTRPSTQKASKPSTAPAPSTKPTQKPAEKPPELDIKTNL